MVRSSFTLEKRKEKNNKSNEAQTQKSRWLYHILISDAFLAKIYLVRFVCVYTFKNRHGPSIERTFPREKRRRGTTHFKWARYVLHGEHKKEDHHSSNENAVKYKGEFCKKKENNKKHFASNKDASQN